MIQKKQETPEEGEDWLTTYADAITLLMAFFVMLLSFMKVDTARFEQAAAAISQTISNTEVVSPTQLLKIDLEDAVINLQADKDVTISIDDRGVVIDLASSAFYKPGSAEIVETAVPVLQKIAEKLLNPRFQGFGIEIEGHTDDDPIATAQFPSNWELSAARATRTVRFVVDRGMGPERFKAVGLAETRPKLANRDANGAPIKENQSKNRRVTIRASPLSQDERREMEARRDLLDVGKQAPGRQRASEPPRPAATAAAPAATAAAPTAVAPSPAR